MRAIPELTKLNDDVRRGILAQLSPAERAKIAAQGNLDNPWMKYVNDPVGFVTEGLGESVWSKQIEILESLRDCKRTAVPAGHSVGKALTLDTPVPTLSGWKRHGELITGDVVFDENGDPCNVVNVGVVHSQPTYRVTFSDGTHIDAAGPHEWLVKTRRHGYQIKETRQLTDCWRSNGQGRAAKYAVDVAAPLNIPESNLPVDPYVLGYWLGDGDSDRAYITVHRDDLDELLQNIPYEYRMPISRQRENTVAVSILELTESLKELGVIGNKHIPAMYLRAGTADRWRLLAGLVDSDGWAQGRLAAFSVINETLARDVMELVRSLGGKPKMRTKAAKIDGRFISDSYVVTWTPFAGNPFGLKRKAEALQALTTDKATRRSIANVELLGEREVSCIEVDSPSHLYLAGEGMIPTHNSHLAARAIAWWVCVHPADRVRVVTTATTFRQVRAVLWPHIRRLHVAHHLPGEVLMTEWKIDGIPVADGFSPADHNEAAVQGIHAENLLVVVDEAGGISNTIGQALEALMTGGHTRLLLLGNPPTNEMNTWFERACNSDLYNVIPISTLDTPNLTGEATGDWARNLVDRTWVDDTIREFGEESPFVQARVYARFPRTTTNVVIPIDWAEAAQHEPDLLEGAVRLGVDVAADGGDEFVIARADGMHAAIAHTSTHNDNAVEVAGIVLDHIVRAQETHAERGLRERVRVKIDSIGVGWGVSSLLTEWGKEGRHHADIIPVNVAERASDHAKFANQRAEMWWNLRTLLQPDSEGRQDVTLNVGRRELIQLTAPTYKANSSGRLQIESKADMKRRGVTSPDRAEALLLAVFEPPRKGYDIAAPLSLTQSHTWI